MNFDAEAFFHFQASFIFSKADGSAQSDIPKCTLLPDRPERGLPSWWIVFILTTESPVPHISPDGVSIVMISNTHIHIFTNFTGADFFGGQHTQINIAGSWTQRESAAFSSNNEIYMSDEGSSGKLYYVNLALWIPVVPPVIPPVITTSVDRIEAEVFGVYPIPANV